MNIASDLGTVVPVVPAAAVVGITLQTSLSSWSVL